MQLAQPRNALLLARLQARSAVTLQIERRDTANSLRDYTHAGCHPDIVERLWDKLGAALPGDCCHRVYGTPALVHPNGLILALGIGTAYGVRLLPSSYAEAAQAGAKTTLTWGGDKGMDIRQDFGADWIFGAWLPQEPGWCRAVYDACSHANGLQADPSLPAEIQSHDHAALAAGERQAHQIRLEHRAANGDTDATFLLFELHMNTAVKQGSALFLSQAEALLNEAATAGHPKALEMAAAWPVLRAKFEKGFAKIASSAQSAA